MALVLAAGPALAQQPPQWMTLENTMPQPGIQFSERCNDPGVTCHELIVSEPGRGWTDHVVRLGVGGCIRGPFTVLGKDGVVLLDIPRGQAMPPNCESTFK